MAPGISGSRPRRPGVLKAVFLEKLHREDFWFSSSTTRHARGQLFFCKNRPPDLQMLATMAPPPVPAPSNELSDPNLTPFPTHPGIEFVPMSPCCEDSEIESFRMHLCPRHLIQVRNAQNYRCDAGAFIAALFASSRLS